MIFKDHLVSKLSNTNLYNIVKCQYHLESDTIFPELRLVPKLKKDGEAVDDSASYSSALRLGCGFEEVLTWTEEVSTASGNAVKKGKKVKKNSAPLPPACKKTKEIVEISSERINHAKAALIYPFTLPARATKSSTEADYLIEDDKSEVECDDDSVSVMTSSTFPSMNELVKIKEATAPQVNAERGLQYYLALQKIEEKENEEVEEEDEEVEEEEVEEEEVDFRTNNEERSDMMNLQAEEGVNLNEINQQRKTERAYQIVKKITNDLTGGCSGGKKCSPTYGEFTMGSTTNILNAMQLHKNAIFLDVGSGRGRVNFHCSSLNLVKASIGIEIDENRYQVRAIILKYVCLISNCITYKITLNC